MGQPRAKRDSSQERIAEEREYSEAVNNLKQRITADHRQRVTILMDVLTEMRDIKEPEFTYKMDILKAAVQRGFLQAELKEAIALMQVRKRGQ